MNDQTSSSAVAEVQPTHPEEALALETVLDAASAELLGAFASWCVRQELVFGISDARDALYLETRLGTPLIVEASPSLLIMSLPYPFDVTSDDERAEAIEHLRALIPVRRELAVIGDYAVLPNGAVGLRLYLPMPLTFSEDLVADVVDLIFEHDERAFGSQGVLSK